MRGPRRLTRIAAMLAGAALLSGCAGGLRTPDYPAAGPVGEIDLQWRPQTGMRLVHQVTMMMEASGPLTRPLAEPQKKQRSSLTRVVEVAATGPDYFDLRFTQNGAAIPATARFSTGWQLREIRVDDPGMAAADREAVEAAVRHISGPLAQGAQFFRRWQAGQPQRFDIPLGPLPGASGNGQGTMTFRRVVLVEGRRAAEFDWQGETDFVLSGEPGHGVPGRMRMSGREWRDLSTGASLRLAGTAAGQFVNQGQTTEVSYQTEEVLDLSGSRL
jgi:hypothetical protein